MSEPSLNSIYRQALGRDFERLHPEIQKRFGFNSLDGVASIGRGVMERVWHGKPYTLPFLRLGTWRSIMFPEFGRQVPFTIRNYAYRDRLGRETVTWIRQFQIPGARPRRFDAYMIWSDKRNRIVDYLGTHQHLAVDLNLRVDDEGGLCLHSGEQRFYEGPVAFRFPMFFSGRAQVREWFDESSGKFRIAMRVDNPTWGPLFGYNGAFDVEYLPVSRLQIPRDIKPRREEKRE